MQKSPLFRCLAVLAVFLGAGCTASDGSAAGGADAGGETGGAEGRSADGGAEQGRVDAGSSGDRELPDAGPGGTEYNGDASDAVMDPCADIDCGRGHCEAAFGEQACLCDFGFAGEHCGECAGGYAGDDCNTCAAGFLADPAGSGACLPDPCAGEPCNSHGTCIADGAAAVCRCDRGFDGDDCSECAEGYQGAACDSCIDGYSNPDGRGCQLTACIGVVCSVGGRCQPSPTGPGGFCACEPGYTGADCGQCDTSYSDDGTGHCVFDACAGVECGAGTCTESPTGSGTVCVCDEGYTGTACDQCAEGFVLSGPRGAQTCQNVLPVRTGLHLWFDAADLTTIDANDQGQVMNWWDKLGSGHGDDHQRFYAPAVNRYPDLYLFPPAIHFSEGQQLLSTLNMFQMLGAVGSDGDFTILIVAQWSSTAPDERQTVLAGYFNGAHDGTPIYYLTREASDTLQFSYRPTFDTEQADVTTLSGLSANTRQLIVTERRPFLNGVAQVLSSGGSTKTIAAMHEGPIETDVISIIGSRTSTLTSKQEPFNGSIHEILVYTTALSSKDRAAVDAYLKVKWGL